MNTAQTNLPQASLDHKKGPLRWSFPAVSVKRDRCRMMERDKVSLSFMARIGLLI